MVQLRTRHRSKKWFAYLWHLLGYASPERHRLTLTPKRVTIEHQGATVFDKSLREIRICRVLGDNLLFEYGWEVFRVPIDYHSEVARFWIQARIFDAIERIPGHDFTPVPEEIVEMMRRE